MNKTKIEWTDVTWNPITGCTPISDGCDNCYAAIMARRLRAMGNGRYQNGFRVTTHSDLITAPLKWRKPRMVFVCSMSDIFHPAVPTEFIQLLFNTMERAEQHIFQVLTKRSSRMLELSSSIPLPNNIWLGVTVESEKYLHRVRDLKAVQASTKFLSIEPMIASLGELNLSGIDWVIAGGESGPKSRPMDESWAIEIRDNCLANNVPFFFKQWGGRNKRKAGRSLQGKTWDQYPLEKSTPIEVVE
jgi:protein gp37